MSRDALADAYDALGDAYKKTARALRGDEPAQAAVPAAGGASAAPPPRSPAPADIDTSKCPKHGTPWEQGQYGEYCKQRTDDPAWGKEKTDRDGNKVFWCKLTPKNAPHWVGVHGAAAAMDVDDVPF